jgi:hypothetical protein
MVKETRGGGRHGTDWGYGSFGGGGHGGSDEGWGDEGDDGTGWDFNYKQKWKPGDQVRWGGGIATVVSASEVDSGVKIKLDSGKTTEVDGEYLKRA